MKKSLTNRPATNKVSIKARKYVKNKVSGMSDYQAAIQAGYSPNTAIAAKQNIENPSVRGLIEDLMDEYGLSDECLLNSLIDGLSNSSKIMQTGDEIVEYPDYAVRHKYLETALKLKGLLNSGVRETQVDFRAVIAHASQYVIES